MSNKRKIDNIINHINDSNKKRKTYIRASSVSNYMMKDCIVDYINNKNNTGVITNNTMEQGNIFERELLKIISVKHKVYIPELLNYDETVLSMEKGENIIYQGYLLDGNNIGGSPDLIVKSTYINKLMESNIITEEEAIKESVINGITYSYHYIIIDIKHSKIHLTGKYIKNTNRIPAYKAQLYIYTRILNKIQNFNINKAYIWGKEYSNGSYFLNSLGLIDYDGFDKDYIQKTNNAIDWIDTLNTQDLSINPPTIYNLYPNMKSVSLFKEKKEINNSINDITTIWHCGIKQREKAFSHNIFSWKDERLSAEILGFKNDKAEIINNIISINQQDEQKIRITKPIVLNYKDNSVTVFLDFEGFSEKVNCNIKDGEILGKNKYYIYMIGIGYTDNNKWSYKSFILEKLSFENQINLFTSLFYYLRTLMRRMKKNYIHFYHWSHYEKTFFNKFKDNLKLCIPDDNYDFNDLCKVFEKSVVIKDCFNFKLKDVSSALYKNNIISTYYNDNNNIVNGLDAANFALALYNSGCKNKIKNNTVMKSIEEYNEVDCKLVCELYTLMQNLII